MLASGQHPCKFTTPWEKYKDTLAAGQKGREPLPFQNQLITERCQGATRCAGNFPAEN